MKQLATVVIENGRPMAEVIRPEACMTCNACKHGRQERMLMDLPQGDYREGEQVELTLPDGRVGKASLLAYGIPLVGLLGGLGLGYLLFDSELGQLASALLLTALSVGVLKLIEPRIRRNGDYVPDVCPRHPQDS